MAKKKMDLPKVRELKAQKEAYLRAFVQSGFVHAKAMEMVGIKSRTTIWEWRKTDVEFANALLEVREQEGDWYENQLRTLSAGIPKVDADGKLIGWHVKPSKTAIITKLNAQFKDRGYGYRVQHDHQHSSQKKESRIDLNRLTKEQRETWYKLLDLATIPDDEIQDAEIVE